MKKDTSWNNVADWYDELLTSDSDSYQEKVIGPNILRILGQGNSKALLDLGCGQGFFSEKFAHAGWNVTGADLSPRLIEQAQDRVPRGNFGVCSADDLSPFDDNSFDTVVSVLAIQNMEHLDKVIKEVGRVLKKDGRFIFILNHPSFRIPKASSWGFDEESNQQYRRVDAYMSERPEKIDMTPGQTSDKEYTISFHRPLQTFGKLLGKNKLFISRLEEWISHKTSQKGPRKEAEDTARKEFPLFLCIETTKIAS